MKHFFISAIVILANLASVRSEDSASFNQQAAGWLVDIIIPREVLISALTAKSQIVLERAPADKKEAVKEAIQRFAVTIADSPQLKARVADLLMETFSESEIKEYVAFYFSPIGEKFIKKVLLPQSAEYLKESSGSRSSADSAELKTNMTALLYETFSKPELKEFAAFYSSPAGKKFLEQVQPMMQKVNAIGIEVSRENFKSFTLEVDKIVRGE